MSEERCEMRFDISLPNGGGTREFERRWRETLAAQKMSALAMPPARTLAARFRLFGPPLMGDQSSAWERFLPMRLAALPGQPTVSAEPPVIGSDWQGVKIWLTYSPQELTVLLQKLKKPTAKFRPARGNRR